MKQQKVPRVTAAVGSSPWTWMVAIAAVSATSTSAHAQWSQFGGPNRNFTVDAKGLADKWPEEGPRRIWERDLGDGYATIVVDNGVLYTMYRKDADEFTVALDAKTGETIWEHGNPSPFTKLMAEYGPGPHSTPLIVGNRLYTIGTNSVMHCFNKKTGRVLWKHDLVDEFGAPIPGRGYASSPIAYKNTVIVPVDRPRKDQEGQSEGDAEATA
ncbi:MAG: PQQ-binding-like beta-propeller repeat protein, partial [Planctomycetes bacterium]|nr:PQQ-binding-like beta-propeller repeat protein [Planctomycetota bacterium]